MAEVSEALLIRIAADVADLKTGLAKAKGEVDGFGKTVKNLATTMGAAFGARQAVDFFKSTVSAAAEAQAVTVKLSAALKAQGDTTQATRDDVLAFSEALQAQTTFDDEAITSTQTLLIQLGRLRGEGLEKATRAALDLSVGLGVDLDTATRMVGKAAAGNTSAFGKLGIGIKSTGDRAKDFDLILNKITDRFGGAATAEVDTYAGAMKQLKNELGNTKEAMGGPFLDSLQTIATQWASWLRDIRSTISVFNEVATPTEELASDIGALQQVLSISAQDAGLAGDQIMNFGTMTAASDGAVVQMNSHLGNMSSQLLQVAASALKVDASQIMSNGLTDEQRHDLEVLVVQLQKTLEERKKLEAVKPPAAPVDQADVETVFHMTEAMSNYGRTGVGAIDLFNARLQQMRGNIAGAREELTRQAVEDKVRHDEFVAGEMAAEEAEKSRAAAQEENAALTRQALESVGGAMLNVAFSGGTMEQRINAALVSIGQTAAQMALQFAINKAMERLYATNTARTSVAASAASAAAGAASSQASIPIIGPSLAAAAAAQTYAMTMAYQGLIPGFKDGGIVGGSPGRNDPNLIRANRGEEVLRADDPRHRNNFNGGGITVQVNESPFIPRSSAEMALQVRKHLKAALQDLHASGELNWSTA